MRAWGAATSGRRVPQWSVAMNLVIAGKGGTHAVGGTARGRLFFLAPWRGATIAGTSHDPWTGTADQLVPRREFVDQLLDDVNAAFPRAAVRPTDIRLVHRGLLPATEASERRVTLLRESPFIDHGEDGCANLFSLVGVRYTTARHSAERAVDAIVRVLDIVAKPSATATTKLDGGDIERFDTFVADAMRQATPDVPASLIERLVCSYGTAWRDVVATRAITPPARRMQAPEGASLQPLGSRCDVTARGSALCGARGDGHHAGRRAAAPHRGRDAVAIPGQDAVQAAADDHEHGTGLDGRAAGPRSAVARARLRSGDDSRQLNRRVERVGPALEHHQREQLVRVIGAAVHVLLHQPGDFAWLEQPASA